MKQRSVVPETGGVVIRVSGASIRVSSVSVGNAAGAVDEHGFNLSLCIHVSIHAGRLRKRGFGGC